MELIPSNKGKQRRVSYVGVNKFREVIYVTSNPVQVCLVQLSEGKAQLYNVLTGEVTRSASLFTCLEKWVEAVLATKDGRKVFAFATESAKFKMLTRLVESNAENRAAAVEKSSEFADVYEIVTNIEAPAIFSHTTHRFLTGATSFPSKLIYVTKLGYTWVDAGNDLSTGKFFETVAEAVKFMQDYALDIYMEKR